jgi:hypothetical protein
VGAGAKSGEDFGRTMPEPIAELMAERRSTAFDAILVEGLFESICAKPVKPPQADRRLATLTRRCDRAC